ncbi:MAG: MEKHLA domain-containing protein [Candidatus Manganitrophaceae bacterium]|nr:MAG: MEKHLA domain-containing protein [Candidatus Manganitrophaceae bacterium]
MPIDAKTNAFFTQQTERLLRSFTHWTGRELLAPADSFSRLAERLFHAPFVVVSHGTEPDPILNYGNQTALALWETPWETFTQTPSRLTAEPVSREERARLLEEVTRKGFIDHYRGIRISRTGRRFFIEQAVVWNLLDEENRYCGQAATFFRWNYL